jgi:hypothetical protein
VRLWRALGTVSYINIIEGYTRTRESSEPSNIDLIFTNEDDMVDRIVHESPLGRSDHCALLFKFNCYYEIKGNAIQRWNFYKGDYTEMAKKMDSDWKTTLSEKDLDTSFELFLKAFERAKEKGILKCSSKAGTKAKKHNYLPLDERTIREIKHKHRCWTRYMENRPQTIQGICKI